MSDELNDINLNDEALASVNNAADLKQFYEDMERAEEIKRSIDEHTEERAGDAGRKEVTLAYQVYH